MMVYRNILLAVTLELLLVFVDYHALNGVRIILIEFHQGTTWERRSFMGTRRRRGLAANLWDENNPDSKCTSVKNIKLGKNRHHRG